MCKVFGQQQQTAPPLPGIIPSPKPYRIAFMGDSGVGKSCLLMRFVGEEFPEIVQTTLLDFFITTVHTVENVPINLELIDTAGQERFNTITVQYFRQAAAVVAVYDESRRPTLDKLFESWLPLLRASGGPARFVLLVGNKIDLTTERRRAEMECAVTQLCEQNTDFRFMHIRLSAMDASRKDCRFVIESFARKLVTNGVEPDSEIKNTQPCPRPL